MHFALAWFLAAQTVPEDAAAIIEALEPGWIPKEVAPLLGIER